MANDALERSRSEHDQSLERQVKDLQAILGHLLKCINEAHGRAEHDGARIERCAAMAESAAARAELAISKAQEAVHAEALLRQVAEAAGDGEGQRPRHAARPKRDRHGLRLVTAFTLLGSVLAGLRAAAFATTARKAAMVAVTLATAGGIAVAPALQGTGATDAHGVHDARDFDDSHHLHQKARRRDHYPAAAPQQRTATLRRRQRDHDIEASAPPPSPDPSPTDEAPSPDPSPSAVPGPSVTGSPVPGPSVSPGLPVAVPQWQH